MEKNRDRWIYYKADTDIWRIFVGPTSTVSLPLGATATIVAKLKPVLDLITPTQNTHRDWVYWIITEDEYESLMGEGDGPAT
jgi:hypothetical protein